MARSPSSSNHLLKPRNSLPDKNVPQRLESSSSSNSEFAGKGKTSKDETASTTKTKTPNPAPKLPIRKKGVAQIIKAPPKRTREVIMTASTAIGSKQKYNARSPSPDSSEEGEARENSQRGAAKRSKQIHKIDSKVDVDDEAKTREAEEDAALDEAEKKIAARKKYVKAKKGDAKQEAKKIGTKKATPQKKTRKEDSEEEEGATFAEDLLRT